jgi:hypothetical protein
MIPDAATSPAGSGLAIAGKRQGKKAGTVIDRAARLPRAHPNAIARSRIV